MAYLLYTEGDSATVVTRGFVLTDEEAQSQMTFGGVGANEKLLPIASSVTPEARPITGITLNSDASEITGLSYTDAATRTTAEIKADARLHLRSRRDEMNWIWGPEGQRWRNCKLWLLSMAAVIKGICDVIDDESHAEHANWSISDAEDALAAAKALAPETIPGDRLAALATALNLSGPVDPQGVRFWYFGHTESGWTGYFGAVDTMSPPRPNENLSMMQTPHFAWTRGASIPSFADDASSATAWGSNLGNTLDLDFNAVTAEVESILT